MYENEEQACESFRCSWLDGLDEQLNLWPVNRRPKEHAAGLEARHLPRNLNVV